MSTPMHGTVMQARLPGRRMVVVHAFPSSDQAFAAAVSTTVQAERLRTTDADDLHDAVTAALRRAYPNARLVVQDDLGHVAPSHETWYAFRDAFIRGSREPGPT
jgi:hypothetical protein